MKNYIFTTITVDATTLTVKHSHCILRMLIFSTIMRSLDALDYPIGKEWWNIFIVIVVVLLLLLFCCCCFVVVVVGFFYFA